MAAAALLASGCGARWSREQEIRAGTGEQRVLLGDTSPGEMPGKRYAVVYNDTPDARPGVDAFKGRLREKGTGAVAEDPVGTFRSSYQ